MKNVYIISFVKNLMSENSKCLYAIVKIGEVDVKGEDGAGLQQGHRTGE